VSDAVVLASRNAHKAAELAALLGGEREVRPLPDGIRLPPETGSTFLEHARPTAAAAAAALPGATVLADDSGLECVALGGAPGGRSARFAGEVASDADNLAHLLERLAGDPDRRAAYVCALVEIAPDGRRREAQARCEGHIVEEPRGAGGFGYDPAFVPAGGRRTMAELSAAEKHALSHRGIAARTLAITPWAAPP
jgi:XTP/dITP diphosphohydrolase